MERERSQQLITVNRTFGAFQVCRDSKPDARRARGGSRAGSSCCCGCTSRRMCLAIAHVQSITYRMQCHSRWIKRKDAKRWNVLDGAVCKGGNFGGPRMKRVVVVRRWSRTGCSDTRSHFRAPALEQGQFNCLASGNAQPAQPSINISASSLAIALAAGLNCWYGSMPIVSRFAPGFERC